jgi:glycosyl transferase family 25
MNLLQHTLYINLDHRTDRREELEAELAKAGITHYERFPAIRSNPGIIGCGLSHLAVLKLARSRGYRNVLIFEDDFEFLVDRETFWKYMEDLFAEVKSYDVVMLAYAIDKSEPFSPLAKKVLEGQTASGYIVHSRFYDTLIELYEDAIPKLISTGEHWIYANDQVWKKLQPTSEWYATTTRIGKQRASMSDSGTQPVFTDYGQ